MNRQSRRRLGLVLAVLALGVAGLQLSACGESSTEAATKTEPSDVEPIKGTNLKRVKLAPLSAKRLGIKTAPIRGRGDRKLIPYSAVIYDEHGGTFTYTSPEPLAYVKQRISVKRIDGGEAILSHGPPAGTAVVTVGAQELYGIEYEVEED